MRPVIVCNVVSLDGYYADASGDPPFAGMDAAFDAYNLERIRNASTILLWRNSFDGFAEYWPTVADAPQDPDDRSVDAVNRGISRRYLDVPKVVVSDSLVLDPDHPWTATTSVISGREVPRWVHHARQSGQGEILIFGSRVLWNGLLTDGLVDEVHLMIAPVVLGEGTPAVRSSPHLHLLGIRQFPGSDNVLLRYGVDHAND